MKAYTFDWLRTSPIAQLLCCVDGHELDTMHRDNMVRADVRAAMAEHMGYARGGDCIRAVMQHTLQHEQYNLGDHTVLTEVMPNCTTAEVPIAHRLIREANEGVRRTHRAWDEYFARMGVDPLTLSSCVRPARIIPRFAAAMALHVRSKLGRLDPTEANVLLVQRKYLEVCGRSNVRTVDIISHQQFVVNAVFGEDLLDRVGLVRARAPRWMRWLADAPVVKAAPQPVC